MGSFRVLYGRRLWEHPLRTAVTMAGIAGACALLVAVLALSESLTSSIGRSAALAGRADVQVSGVTDTGVDDTVVTQLVQVPGVAAVVPYVQTPIEVRGIRAWLLGFDERAAAVGLQGDD